MPHTPGPWTTYRNGKNSNICINAELEKGRWKCVAVASSNWDGTNEVKIDEAEANARLIENAPDLLDRAKLIIACRGEDELANAISNMDKLVQRIESDSKS